MERPVFIRFQYVCALCRAASSRRLHSTRLLVTSSQSNQRQCRNLSTKTSQSSLSTAKRGQNPVSPQRQRHTRLSSQDSARLQRLADRVLRHENIPPESETLSVLNAIEASARELLGLQDPTLPNSATTKNKTPASALLSLDSSPIETSVPAAEAVNFLSRLAYSIVKNELVDLTPSILKVYVEIQCLLSRPATLPEVFHLYSNKPIPARVASSNPLTIKFDKPAPDAIAMAVPATVANRALRTAIHVRDLESALDIIDTTFRRKAYERNKIFRNALPPVAAATLAPVAAYALAVKFADIQTNLPSESATTIAFAGLTTYAAVASMLGYVSLTSSNDQMERVTWVLGTPLWERWVREEERAACDVVAKAWGFKEKSKWGEEEGEQWESLKEWLGVRGMILDKVGLMEGME